jgi:hypothetical protein
LFFYHNILNFCILLFSVFQPPIRTFTGAFNTSKEQDNAKAPLSIWLPLSLLHTAIPIADLFTIMGEGKGRPTMVPGHHLLLSPYRCHAPSSMLMQLMALHKQAGNSRQCQGTVVHAAATVIIAHSCLCCCHLRHCRRGQGMGNNAAKAPSSARLPLLLCTLIHTATIDAFAQASKEWATMSWHRCPCCRHRCHRALPFAPLP